MSNLGVARAAFVEAYFARRDLARLGLLALFYLTLCVFAPIFVGRLVLHRPLPAAFVVALFPVAWTLALVWAGRVRTIWRVERIIRAHARRSGRAIDVRDVAHRTGIPAPCVEYVVHAMEIEGTVERADTGTMYRLAEATY